MSKCNVVLCKFQNEFRIKAKQMHNLPVTTVAELQMPNFCKVPIRDIKNDMAFT